MAIVKILGVFLSTILLGCQAAGAQDAVTEAYKAIAEAEKAVAEAEAEALLAQRSKESYLCIPEAVVGIRTVENSFEPGVIDARNRKIVLSNATGQFHARWHGNNHPFLDKCDAQGWSCKFDLDGDGGTFSRTSAGTFLMSWGELGPNNQEAYYLARGRCSRI
ncbi:hypothetical protein [Stenotrophomonas acidaminiphila]|uniref:hypothetical protein n=1 Tax=Stenotrophomonas acidaminiphila TaxID=128780 RepID=UPI0028ADDDBB|nr:hypothetical protein [Stenotrophomonas acidaminiphila]